MFVCKSQATAAASTRNDCAVEDASLSRGKVFLYEKS